MKVSSKKNKGRRLQQKIAKKISDMLNIPWGSDELIRSREGGQAGTDIVLLGEALELFPFSIEIKNVERFDLNKSIEQAKSNQKENTDWMVIRGKNNEKPIVIMDLDTFFRLYSDYLDWTEGKRDEEI